MQVHILLFDDKIERASMGGRKMQELANTMNGDRYMVGPYVVVSIVLEDAILTHTAPDSEGQCEL